MCIFMKNRNKKLRTEAEELETKIRKEEGIIQIQ